jgi:dextranase
LRDGGSFITPQLTSEDTDVKINVWPPVYGQVAAVGKSFENRQTVQLLNFDGVTTFQWRDDEKIQEQPRVKSNFEVTIQSSKPVSKVWFASPDINGGASQELEFTQNGSEITVTVPYLEYWSMLVLEQ